MIWLFLVLFSPLIFVAGMMLFLHFFEPITKFALKHPDKCEKIEKIYNRFHRKKRK